MRNVAGNSIRAVLLIASAFFIPSAAHAGSILYTFTGTTAPIPSLGIPPSNESFQLLVQDFLPLLPDEIFTLFFNGDPELLSCIPCGNFPGVPLLGFARGGFDDLQFNDSNRTGYAYDFPLGAFSNLGTYQTFSGTNVNIGTLTVSAVPEPSTAFEGAFGLGLVIAAFRRRSASRVARG
jgi:hypothetical protein